MAWERSFEARVMKIREKELKYQRLNYIIEVSPLLCGDEKNTDELSIDTFQ